MSFASSPARSRRTCGANRSGSPSDHREPFRGRKQMTQIFRKGAVGALMDEYERAAAELSELVSRVNDEEFEIIRDPRTQDEACRSIQTVVNHVVRAGY